MSNETETDLFKGLVERITTADPDGSVADLLAQVDGLISDELLFNEIVERIPGADCEDSVDQLLAKVDSLVNGPATLRDALVEIFPGADYADTDEQLALRIEGLLGGDEHTAGPVVIDGDAYVVVIRAGLPWATLTSEGARKLAIKLIGAAERADDQSDEALEVHQDR